jgi:Tfp pilus assembly protein PilN
LIRINLLPRVPRRRIPGRQIIEYGLPVLALVVVVVLGIMLRAQIEGLQRQIAEADSRIAELRPQVERVQELEKRIAALKEREQLILALVRQQLPAASVLNEVRLLIPKDAWVTSLSVPEASALAIDGYALSYPVVAQFMDNLKAGQLFREVDLTVAQTERIGLRDVVKFSVTARIQKPQATGGDRP